MALCLQVDGEDCEATGDWFNCVYNILQRQETDGRWMCDMPKRISCFSVTCGHWDKLRFKVV